MPSVHAILQSGNLYVFGINNPVMWIDPSGLFILPAIPIIKKAIKAIRTINTIYNVATAVVSTANTTAATAGVMTGGAGASSHSANPSMQRASPQQITQDLGNIARQHGQFQCAEAARAMATHLQRSGHQVQFAEFLFSGRSYVVSDSSPIFGPNVPISETGYHIGVLFNNRVFCNVHPQGLPTGQWFNDFHGIGIRYEWISPTPIGPQELFWRFNRMP